MIIKNEDCITNVNNKIADAKQYLMFDSCHPKHTRQVYMQLHFIYIKDISFIQIDQKLNLIGEEKQIL